MNTPNYQKPVYVRQMDPQQSMFGSGFTGGTEQLPTGFAPEGQFSPFLPATTAPAKSGSGLLGGMKFSDLKGIIDRMGGIDGVLNTVTKVQKVMQSVQQFAPMLRLLLPKLGKKTTDQDEDDLDDYPRRRRRRRRRLYGRRRRRRYYYYTPRRRRPRRRYAQDIRRRRR